MKTVHDHPAAHAHDHRSCISTALKRAEAVCASHGSKLTPLRLQVLEALWSSHEARGAYDLLNQMNSKAKRKLAPLSVYRALDFLVTEGLAHRIESLNAYIGCPHPQQQHALQFLICQSCRHVEELEEARISKALQQSAAQRGFTPTQAVVELIGTCAACTAATA